MLNFNQFYIKKLSSFIILIVWASIWRANTNISMLQRNLKAEQIRKEVRKEHLAEIFQNKRSKLMLIEQQEKEYLRTGQLGLELLKYLGENTDWGYVKRQKDVYPREKFYQFLEPTYDCSQQQLFAVRIIEQYFYFESQDAPEEHFIDKILRIFIQVDNIEIKMIIMVMLRKIVQDNYNYGTFLIKFKKIVPKLLSIAQTYTNNSQIKISVYKLIHRLVQNTFWHDDIPQLVNPLIRMMQQQQNVEIIAQTLFNIAQLKPEYFGPILYQKKIIRICFDIINQHHSRIVTLLYLKLLLMIEKLLQFTDVVDALETISYMEKLKFKVGDGRAKFSVYEVKLAAFRFINNLLRSENDSFRQAGISYISENVRNMRCELEQSDDEAMLAVVTEILLAFYLQSLKELNQEFQSLIQSVINKCESYSKRAELQAQYDHIIRQKSKSLGLMEIEI